MRLGTLIMLGAAGCATPVEAPHAPGPEPERPEAEAPATKPDEPAPSRGEIDLGFDGSYGNIEIDQTGATPKPRVRGANRERKKLGDRCGGVGYVRCDVDMYCADRPLDPWEENASDVMGECRSCDELTGTDLVYCRNVSRADDVGPKR